MRNLSMVEILNTTNGVITVTKIVATGVDSQALSALTSTASLVIIPRFVNFTLPN